MTPAALFTTRVHHCVDDLPLDALEPLFTYLHLPTGPDSSPVPPAADRIEDVRDRLRDPAAARHILVLDGLNLRVQDVVLNTRRPRTHRQPDSPASVGPRRRKPGRSAMAGLR
ncbi:hypothetical protein [Streptomyces sp. NBC_00076]|uniref:hypothetical protein n=1 Tax=Streptomyces sp. NBC_00076 TaxID=2975642 RepID=UPI0032471F52